MSTYIYIIDDLVFFFVGIVILYLFVLAVASVSYTHLDVYKRQGGTIGMIENPETGALENFNFDHLLKHVPELKRFNYRCLLYTSRCV